MKNTYMSTPCGISDSSDRLTSHVETSIVIGIHVPADGKSKACIIRRLSNSKCVVRCLWCGDEFITYYCKINNNRGKYCSKRCLGNAAGAQRLIDGNGVLTPGRVKGNLNPNWKGGDFRDCIICGAPFWLYPSRNQETCSHDCGVKRANLVRSGDLYSLGNRRKHYGHADNWEKLREIILERDCFTCQACGVSFKDNTGFLHVHHMIRLVDGGGNDFNNLMTLCRNCHTYIHRFDRIR